jgi:poly(3-hydroxybutyrate) depolymerase
MFKMRRLMEMFTGKPRPKRKRGIATPLGVEQLEDRRVLANMPDLVPLLVEAPELSSQQQIMVVETQVDNIGTMRSGRFEVQYFLSLDSTFDPQDRLLGTLDPLGNVVTLIERPSIPQSGSDTWLQQLAIPEDLPQGRFYVGVVLDPRNLIVEISEANNELSDTNQINVLKGLPLGECAGNTVEQAGTAFLEGVNCRFIEVDGYARTYVVYVPTGVLAGPDVPLVSMHHGSSGNGGQFLNISGWREKADVEDLIVTFPTGAMYCKVGFACENGKLRGWTTKWNSFSLASSPDFNFAIRPPGYDPGAPWPADDVQFEGMMLDDLETNLPVDTHRMYATGFSNGAAFTARLAVERSDRFAAAAYVAGGLTSAETPVELIPTFEVHGTKDDGLLTSVGLTPADEIPLDPQQFLAFPRIANSVTDALDTFQLVYDPIDSILGADVVTQDPISTQLTWQTPAPGNTSGNVHHFAMWAGLTHHYPHGFDATKNPNGFNAADTFWDFFMRSAPVACDFNDNGQCDMNDIDELMMEISSGGSASIFDLNGDSQVNLLDRDEWLVLAGAENLLCQSPYLLGDFNLDGLVDGSDFGIWNSHKFTSTGTWSQGDANGDGVTDGSDFGIWNGSKFTSSCSPMRPQVGNRLETSAIQPLSDRSLERASEGAVKDKLDVRRRWRQVDGSQFFSFTNSAVTRSESETLWTATND